MYFFKTSHTYYALWIEKYIYNQGYSIKREQNQKHLHAHYQKAVHVKCNKSLKRLYIYISILEKSVIGRICLIFCIKRLNQNEFKVNVHLNDINVILDYWRKGI